MFWRWFLGKGTSYLFKGRDSQLSRSSLPFPRNQEVRGHLPMCVQQMLSGVKQKRGGPVAQQDWEWLCRALFNRCLLQNF